MKKLLYSALIASLFAVSCTKEKQQAAAPASAHELRSALTVLDPHLQRKFFRSQSPALKAAIWQDKFENILSHEWTPAQLRLIYDINKEIKSALFAEESPENQNFVKIFNPKWKKQLALAFTPAQADNLFARLENVGVAQRSNVPDPECYCSVNDDWCIGETCTWGGCTIQTWGCGTLWTYYCTGLCD